MSLRIPMCWRVFGGLALVLAFTGAARADDPATVKQLQETVTKLEKKVADLEAKVAALEKHPKVEPGSKTDKNDEEYVKLKATGIIDGLLAGDAAGVRGLMTTKLLKGINTFWEVGTLNHNTAVDDWIGKWNSKKLYSSQTIDKVVFSPMRDEVVIQGSIVSRDGGARATFTMTLIKDKDRYMLDACSLREK